MKKYLLLAAAAAVALTTTAYAGETDTMAQGQKVLVVYYSRTGNTERVARDVASALGADIEKLVDTRNRKGIFGFLGGGRDAMKKNRTELGPLGKDPASYDLVVLGTPVWAGNITPALRTYLAVNKEKLKSIAYIITSGSTPAEKIVPLCEDAAGKKSVAYAGFVEKDLRDEKVYREKLAKFIEALKR